MNKIQRANIRDSIIITLGASGIFFLGFAQDDTIIELIGLSLMIVVVFSVLSFLIKLDKEAVRR